MGSNIFAQGMDAFDRSYDRTQAMRDQRTRNRAAPRIASGDFQGAAQEYGAGGMADEARQSVADQQTVDDRGKAEQKRKAEMLMKAAEGLKTVPAGQRKAALSHPIFQQLGLGPDMTDQITEDQLSDQSLDMFTTEVKKQYSMAALGNGGVGAFDPEHGTLKVLREPEYEQKYAAVPEGGKLVPIPRGDQPARAVEPFAGGGAAPTGAPPEGVKALASMGVTITSGQRSREHNAAVGGAPNSRHLTGEAADLVPPRGMTMAQLEAEVRAKVPGAKVINEGDHVHVQWGGAQASGGDPPGTLYGAPKGADWTTLPQAEASAYGPGQYQRNAKTGEVKQVSGTAPKGSTGKLPAAALNLQNQHLEALQTASAINTRLQSIGSQIDKGDLNLGLTDNLFARGKNLVGMSDPQSRNFASFRADLEKLRNDSLKLNKGVQTEGDAQRAWNELMANLNDEKAVRQRLAEIDGYNTQAMAFHQDSVDQLREDAGLPPIDTARFKARPTARGPAAITAQRAKPAQSAAPRGPQRGQVVKGYRFNGGDPAKPQSWTKVQ